MSKMAPYIAQPKHAENKNTSNKWLKLKKISLHYTFPQFFCFFFCFMTIYTKEKLLSLNEQWTKKLYYNTACIVWICEWN